MKTDKELSKNLDELAENFKHMARIIRGEVKDLTGLGYWRILLNRLEHVMDCKTITPDQYKDYMKLSEEDYKRRGGQTSY